MLGAFLGPTVSQTIQTEEDRGRVTSLALDLDALADISIADGAVRRPN